MRRLALLVLAIFGLSAAPAAAQATRTWVSGVGDDANPCSRTAPCKTFAGAISKTAASGEISVLDPGGFGTLTITKSISIVARGLEGGIAANLTNGITISAGANDVVSLRGLQIDGYGTGTNGVRVLQAGNVYISDTVIRGFNAGTGYGVDVESPGAATFVYLRNVEINNNINGVYVHSTGPKNKLFLDHCSVEGNSLNSLIADTGTSTIFTSGSVFPNSAIMLSNGAQLASSGNNFITGGTAPTVSVPLQ